MKLNFELFIQIGRVWLVLDSSVVVLVRFHFSLLKLIQQVVHLLDCRFKFETWKCEIWISPAENFDNAKEWIELTFVDAVFN